jgi:hypothetical protein
MTKSIRQSTAEAELEPESSVFKTLYLSSTAPLLISTSPSRRLKRDLGDLWPRKLLPGSSNYY